MFQGEGFPMQAGVFIEGSYRGTIHGAVGSAKWVVS